MGYNVLEVINYKIMVSTGEFFWRPVYNNSRYYVKKREIYVYPSMWNMYNQLIPTGSIAVSDKMILNSMPYAYATIRNGINM